MYFVIKRIFDIVVSLIVLLLMIPLSIILKIITIFTGNFNSIFFTQMRIGKNGKKFKLYKYTSMVPDADKKLEELLKIDSYNQEWKENQKLKNDPRVTKIGSILRKTTLDELPQFINILKGDMSIVGPRPLVEGELDAHHGNHKLYESVKPGLTGWWACNNHYNFTYKERLDLEYYYIKNMSLSLDIKCIVKTIGLVLFKK